MDGRMSYGIQLCSSTLDRQRTQTSGKLFPESTRHCSEGFVSYFSRFPWPHLASWNTVTKQVRTKVARMISERDLRSFNRVLLQFHGILREHV
jgi:hypothetical protein